jgi:2-dehydro-3-deoxyphosphogluconate aldolase/(4S)-4-hydroxy-2-oxoglutarate aldolase
MRDPAATIREVGIIPVIRGISAKHVMLTVEALCTGGIPIAEITMTLPNAIELINELSRSVGDKILIGAGTVLDAETAECCIRAGAQFVVSPGVDLETIRIVKKRGRLMLAGALTPTEAIAAWKFGSDFVKVFPCGPVGGAAYIKALKAPLPQIPMIPTGGVTLENAADFMRAGADAIGVGHELISEDALAAKHKSRITDLARRYVTVVREARKNQK